MRHGVNVEACGVSCRGRCYSTSGRGTSPGSVLLLKLPSACPSTMLTHRSLSSALSTQHLAGAWHTVGTKVHSGAGWESREGVKVEESVRWVGRKKCRTLTVSNECEDAPGKDTSLWLEGLKAGS